MRTEKQLQRGEPPRRATPGPPSSSGGPLLTATGLGRRLDDAWIWRHLDVRLDAGSNLAVIGPTGAGKSLLLRALAALDPLDEGDVAFAGRSISDWGIPDYRARVVYLQQRPALWDGDVEDNLRAVFDLDVHRSRKYDCSLALERLAAFGRGPEFLGKAASELSGGEAQIVALVRALSVEPRVLLLDEPAASMDARATEQAEELVRDWVATDPTRACIWTSHDARQVERVADRTQTLGPTSGSEPTEDTTTWRAGDEVGRDEAAASGSAPPDAPRDRRDHHDTGRDGADRPDQGSGAGS